MYSPFLMNLTLVYGQSAYSTAEINPISVVLGSKLSVAKLSIVNINVWSVFKMSSTIAILDRYTALLAVFIIVAYIYLLLA